VSAGRIHTVDAAERRLAYDDAPFVVEELSPTYRVLVVEYADLGFRVYSDDTEAELVIAFTEGGHVTGEKLKLATTDEGMIGYAIGAAVTRIMDKADADGLYAEGVLA
jgi:hypothetical protein